MPIQNIKDVLKNWLKETSLRQLNNIERAKNHPWKIFWIIISILLLIFAILHGSLIANIFLQYRTETVVNIKDARGTTFPAVTICNLNPISIYSADYILKLKELRTIYRYSLSLKQANPTLTYDADGRVVVGRNTNDNDSATQERKKRSPQDEYRSTDFTELPTIEPSAGECEVTTIMMSTTTTDVATSSRAETTSTVLSTAVSTELRTSITPTTTEEEAGSTEPPATAPTLTNLQTDAAQTTFKASEKAATTSTRANIASTAASSTKEAPTTVLSIPESKTGAQTTETEATLETSQNGQTTTTVQSTIALTTLASTIGFSKVTTEAQKEASESETTATPSTHPETTTTVVLPTVQSTVDTKSFETTKASASSPTSLKQTTLPYPSPTSTVNLVMSTVAANTELNSISTGSTKAQSSTTASNFATEALTDAGETTQEFTVSETSVTGATTTTTAAITNSAKASAAITSQRATLASTSTLKSSTSKSTAINPSTTKAANRTNSITSFSTLKSTLPMTIETSSTTKRITTGQNVTPSSTVPTASIKSKSTTGTPSSTTSTTTEASATTTGIKKPSSATSSSSAASSTKTFPTTYFSSTLTTTGTTNSLSTSSMKVQSSTTSSNFATEALTDAGETTQEFTVSETSVTGATTTTNAAITNSAKTSAAIKSQKTTQASISTLKSSTSKSTAINPSTIKAAHQGTSRSSVKSTNSTPPSKPRTTGQKITPSSTASLTSASSPTSKLTTGTLITNLTTTRIITLTTPKPLSAATFSLSSSRFFSVLTTTGTTTKGQDITPAFTSTIIPIALTTNSKTTASTTPKPSKTSSSEVSSLKPTSPANFETTSGLSSTTTLISSTTSATNASTSTTATIKYMPTTQTDNAATTFKTYIFETTLNSNQQQTTTDSSSVDVSTSSLTTEFEMNHETTFDAKKHDLTPVIEHEISLTTQRSNSDGTMTKSSKEGSSFSTKNPNNNNNHGSSVTPSDMHSSTVKAAQIDNGVTPTSNIRDGDEDSSGDGSESGDGNGGEGSGGDSGNGNGDGNAENEGSGNSKESESSDNGSSDNDDGDGSEDGSGYGNEENGSGDSVGSNEGSGDNNNNGSDESDGNGTDNGYGNGSGKDDDKNGENGNGSGGSDDNAENGNDGTETKINTNSYTPPLTTTVTSTSNTASEYSTTKKSYDNSGTTSSGNTNENEKQSTSTNNNFTTPSINDSNSKRGGNGESATTVLNESKFSTTVSDFLNSPSFISTKKLNSATPTSSTREPIIYDGYTQKELDHLIEKYQIATNASRIALESQTQDRMLSIINENFNASHSLRDIIISCTYDMTPCDYDKDFKLVSDPHFGNCYTYNYKGKSKIIRAGSNYGLKIIALSNVSEYLETTSKSGMKIVVHNHNYAPFPNTEGINVGVGRSTRINVEYNDIQRLGKPYGDCHAENDTSKYIYDGFYHYEGCLRSCFQQRIIDTCGCADPRFPKPSGSDLSWCSFDSRTNFLCYTNYLITYGDYSNVSKCDCQGGCREPRYKLDVSSAIWPANIPNFRTPMCWKYYPGTKIDCYTAYKENAASIDVSFNRLIYQKTTERAAMAGKDFFNQITGAIALWIGVSMIFLMEAVVMIWLCIFRPNINSRAETNDIEMSHMSDVEQNNDGIYDLNIEEEYAMNIPQPIASDSVPFGIGAGLPSPSDFPNISVTHEHENGANDDSRFPFNMALLQPSESYTVEITEVSEFPLPIPNDSEDPVSASAMLEWLRLWSDYYYDDNEQYHIDQPNYTHATLVSVRLFRNLYENTEIIEYIPDIHPSFEASINNN